MASLNIPTVELVSTLRAAPDNGPLVSADYNDSWTESLADLASLSGFINDILIPMLDGLSSTIQPINVATPFGIEGRFIFSDTTNTTDVFYDPLSNESLTIAQSLSILNGIIQATQTTVANLNVEVTALQSQLSSTNQNDIAQALQNFAASLTVLTNQTVSNTQTIINNTITLQTNGANNAVQNNLNLIAGTNITLANSGGDVVISSTGGSSSTPAGLTTEVQVNVAGAFYADAGFVYDHTTQTVTVGGVIDAPLINATTGFLYNNTAAASHFLRGNGTEFISSPILLGDIPAGAVVPAGSDTDIQVNSGGVLYADGGFTYNHSTGVVSITGTSSYELSLTNPTAATSISSPLSPSLEFNYNRWDGGTGPSTATSWVFQAGVSNTVGTEAATLFISPIGTGVEQVLVSIEGNLLVNPDILLNGEIIWSNIVLLTPLSDGVIGIQNDNSESPIGSGLVLGTGGGSLSGNAAIFSAGTGTTLSVRLGDNSADAPLTSAAFTASGPIQGSGFTQSITTQTTTYSTALTDYTVLANSSSGFTITLTTTSIPVGKIYRVKNINTGTITVVGQTGNIDGDINLVIASQNASATFQWDGTNWWIL